MKLDRDFSIFIVHNTLCYEINIIYIIPLLEYNKDLIYWGMGEKGKPVSRLVC